MPITNTAGNRRAFFRRFVPLGLLIASVLQSQAVEQKLSAAEATGIVELNPVCKKAAEKTIQFPGKDGKSVRQLEPLVEKSTAPGVWTILHAQIFQNKESTFLLKNKTPYILGAGTDTVYANGSGGPYSIEVADMNGDHVDDLIYLDKVVLSGVFYDHLRMFDGKRNMTVDGETYMCKNVVLHKDEKGKVTVKLDGKTFSISVAPADKTASKSKLKTALSPDEKCSTDEK